MDDRNQIAHLEERLSLTAAAQDQAALSELEMLADLYIQADSYLPALETIDRLLSLPAARTLSVARRVALESKAVSCRIAHGDAQAALAQCRELMRYEAELEVPAQRARLHLLCARALIKLSRIEEFRERCEAALSLADASGDLALSAQSLLYLGTAWYRTGDLTRARDFGEQALALFRRLGDERNAAYARVNLALIHKNLCEWETAISHLNAAIECFREQGLLPDTARVFMSLGIVHQKNANWVEAANHYRQAEQVYLRVNDQLHLSLSSIGLGNVARLQRRFAEAETHFLAALERARSRGAQREEVLAMEFLGELDFDRGRAEAAVTRYHEALALAERIAPEGDLVVEIERRRAEALCVIGRFDEAEVACERALRLARLSEDRLELAIAHRVRSDIAWARGQRARALEGWSEALPMLMTCRERYETARVLLSLGRGTEDPRAARAHLYRASTIFSEIESSYWLELTDAELQRQMAAGAAMPPSRGGSLLGRRHRAPGLVACSNAMHQIEQLARRAAGTELSVLITGETGTGKELIARTIHGLSARADRPFLAVNCGALRADLALSQLFGHRKGAFTGAHAEAVGLVEAAHGGTLFLDEVGELPLDVQVTMLRFLESGEYLRLGETQVRRADVRVIAATNRLLRGGEGERLFRRDLLFRLNEIEIRLPTLRERLEDVVPLGRHFLAFYGGLEGPRLGPDAEAVLTSYAWPGNVRELENVMKRIAALHAGEDVIDATALLPFLRDGADLNHITSRAGEEEAARSAILTAYREAHGNKSRVAELLGVSRKTLYARLKRLRLELR